MRPKSLFATLALAVFLTAGGSAGLAVSGRDAQAQSRFKDVPLEDMPAVDRNRPGDPDRSSERDRPPARERTDETRRAPEPPPPVPPPLPGRRAAEPDTRPAPPPRVTAQPRYTPPEEDEDARPPARDVPGARPGREFDAPPPPPPRRAQPPAYSDPPASPARRVEPPRYDDPPPRRVDPPRYDDPPPRRADPPRRTEPSRPAFASSCTQRCLVTCEADFEACNGTESPAKVGCVKRLEACRTERCVCKMW